jgi:hypothetical protein
MTLRYNKVHSNKVFYIVESAFETAHNSLEQTAFRFFTKKKLFCFP